MAYDKEFALGLFFHETELTKDIQTNEKQFIFFKVGIKKKELIAYLESKLSEDGDFININIKRSRTNKFYGEVNTFKPEDNQSNRSDSSDSHSSGHLRDFEQQKKKDEWESKKESQSFKDDEIPF